MKYSNNKIYYLAIFFVVSISCSNKNNNINNTTIVKNIDSIEVLEKNIFPIYIDKTKDYEDRKFINLQDIADVEYVKFETTDDCLLKDKSSLTGVYFDENNIFISTSDDNVLRFDKDGKFINSIGKRGAGPNEINLMINYKIDTRTKEIYLLDVSSRKFVVFDYDGKFKRSFKIKNYADNFCIVNDSTLLCTNNKPVRFPIAYTISMNSGEVKDTLIPTHLKKTGMKPYLISFYTKNKIYNNQFLLNTEVTDTIFSINNNTLTPHPRYIQIPANKGVGESNSSFFLIFETNRYANLISLDEPKFFFTYWVDKKKNEIFKGLLFDTEGYCTLFPINTNIDNKLIALYNVSDLKDRLSEGKLTGKIKEITETLQDEDNPVLMIATIDF